MCSGVLVRAWMLGERSSSVKMKVLAAEVARVMRSTAARGDEADLVRARKGWMMLVSGMHDRSDILLPEHSKLLFAPCLPLRI
jgi:hypothetical protein